MLAMVVMLPLLTVAHPFWSIKLKYVSQTLTMRLVSFTCPVLSLMEFSLAS
jgi:hypothetical protein